LDTLEEILNDWGINDIQLFASGTLQRPWRKEAAVVVDPVLLKDVYEMQIQAKERARKVR
jgi:hypothetical protein